VPHLVALYTAYSTWKIALASIWWCWWCMCAYRAKLSVVLAVCVTSLSLCTPKISFGSASGDCRSKTSVLYVHQCSWCHGAFGDSTADLRGQGRGRLTRLSVRHRQAESARYLLRRYRTRVTFLYAVTQETYGREYVRHSTSRRLECTTRASRRA